MTVDTLTQLPAVFGRYVLTRRLSRGGMGEIFLGKVGEIQGFEKPIVIKKILPALSSDADFVQRFIEEAKIAINLSHVNIVPVYEVGKVEDEYFLAMQYVEGRDLRTLLTRARDRGVRMPPDLCLFLVRELANGLAYAHRRTDQSGQPLNLVHCDISPPNVLVSFEGEVKVIDFGIARTTIQRAQDDENVGFGKFGYMAPEQLVRGGTIERRTDIYSSGVVLYELLTGQRLFNFPRNVDYRHVAREVTGGRFLRPSERDPALGDAFDELVLRALRTAPGERYPTAEAFRDAVQAQLYAMNPTINADALASFVRDVFPGAGEEDRKMLRALAQTDLAQFRGAVEDGSVHTVSFALGGAYPPKLGGGGEEGRGASQVPGGRAEGEGMPSLAESTRPLNDRERVAAAVLTGGTRTADLMPSPWRARLLIGGIVAFVLVGVIVAIMLFGGAKSSREVSQTRGASDRDRQGKSSPDLGAHAMSSREASVDAAVMTFTPDPVEGSTQEAKNAGKAPRRRTHRSRRRPRRRHLHTPRRSQRTKEKSITAKRVQRKFRRVRAQYMRFERSYGGRLQEEWQRILFGLTYRKKDPASLDRMLERLRRKMNAIRRGG